MKKWTREIYHRNKYTTGHFERYSYIRISFKMHCHIFISMTRYFSCPLFHDVFHWSTFQ